MTVKEIMKRLKRYPETAEVGVVNTGSFVDGDVSFDFDIRSRKSVSKSTACVGCGFEDWYDSCDVVILV